MKTVVACLSLLALVGCHTPIKEIEIIEVPVHVYIFPKPPEIPSITSKVLALTEADKNDPGKVVQAYKHDHIAHSGRLKELSGFIGHLKDLNVAQSNKSISTVEK